MMSLPPKPISVAGVVHLQGVAGAAPADDLHLANLVTLAGLAVVGAAVGQVRGHRPGARGVVDGVLTVGRPGHPEQFPPASPWLSTAEMRENVREQTTRLASTRVALALGGERMGDLGVEHDGRTAWR